MCFDTDIFETKIDENLICPICTLVLCIDSVQDKHGHTFCRNCIRTWMQRSDTCPINRERISFEILQTIPFALSGILSNLKVKCKYTGNGCKEVIKLEVVNRHENNCQFRMCDDCGLEIKLNHNCALELQKIIQDLKNQLNLSKIAIASKDKKFSDNKKVCEQTNQLLENQLDKSRQTITSKDKEIKDYKDRYKQSYQLLTQASMDNEDRLRNTIEDFKIQIKKHEETEIANKEIYNLLFLWFCSYFVVVIYALMKN